MRPTLIGHGSGHAAAQLQASSHDGQHKRPDAWKMFLAHGCNNRSGPSHLRCIEINFLLLCQSQGVMAVFKAWFTCAFLKQRAPLGKSSLAAAQPFVGLPQGQASAMMNVKTDKLILPGGGRARRGQFTRKCLSWWALLLSTVDPPVAPRRTDAPSAWATVTLMPTVPRA